MIHVSDVERDLIFKLAERLTGCNIETKREIFIQNVLRRMDIRQAESVRSYLQLALKDAEELPHLVSALTIHTTSWFREKPHYEWMADYVATRPDRGTETTIRLLSAGCSTALELYSFGLMFENLRRGKRLLDYSLEGWDIDPITLGKARTGAFPKSDLAAIPSEYHHFFAPGPSPMGAGKETIIVDRAIRDRTVFRAVNILQPPVNTQGSYDFVVCRNVLIYFRMEQVTEIIKKLLLQLNPHGHLILGLSEAVETATYNVVRLGPTVYQALPEKERSPSQSLGTQVPVSPTAHATPHSGKAAKERATLPKILVVEDDPDFMTVLQDILDPFDIAVQTSSNAREALQRMQGESFDLILSDQRMPGMSGVEFLNTIRERDTAVGFILISGYSDTESTQKVLEYGASDVLAKPFHAEDLLTMVARHITLKRSTKSSPRTARTTCDAILIGASTGGPEALGTVLSLMPEGTPPILVVQHISPNFVASLGRHLSMSSGLKLALVKDVMPLRPDTIYMTVEDRHLVLSEHQNVLHAGLSNRPARHGHRPSIDELFESGAACGERLAAMLLTGMGRDGAEGLLQLRRAGCITLAQDEKSSVVFGMPGAAAALGAPMIVGDLTLLRNALGEAVRGGIKRDLARKKDRMQAS